MTESTRKLFAVMAALSFLIAATVAYTIGIYSVRTSLHAEQTFHSFNFVLKILANFLEENNGKWPQSWSELASARPSAQSGLRWPDDLQEIQKRVEIDFRLTTAQVASQDEEHFTAVKMIGPAYPTYKEFVRSLLDVARRTQDPGKEEASKQQQSPELNQGTKGTGTPTLKPASL